MEYKMILPKEVLACIELLEKNGKEAYVVGGAIRSFLLGNEIHDYDLTTNALPEEMHQIFLEEKVIDTGLKHGTLTVIKNHLPIEITTYRKDTIYLDHRHPDEVIFTTSLEEDLKRRDFTMNAIAYHPTKGFIDPFEGRMDIEKGYIRTVGNPSQRFEEDALRILRALRFSSELGFTIEEETSSTIHQKKEDLQYISMERIQMEWMRLLLGKNVEHVLNNYKDVFEIFIPEFKKYSMEEWDQIISILPTTSQNFPIRFSILLTSIKDYLPSSFYRRSKFSNALKKDIKTFLEYANHPVDTTISLRLLCGKMERMILPYLEYRCALNPSLNKKELQEEVQRILREDTYCLKQLKINGNDLISLGLQGPKIQETLDALLDAVIHNKCLNEYEALLDYYKTSLISDNKL